MMGGQEGGLPSLSAHPPAACSPSFLTRLLAVATVRPSEVPYSKFHAPCSEVRPSLSRDEHTSERPATVRSHVC